MSETERRIEEEPHAEWAVEMTTADQEDWDRDHMYDPLPSSVIEYGYRITEGASAGLEVWQVDHGKDGCWLPANATLKIPAIDIYDEQGESAIRDTLARAGVVGVVITREVHDGEDMPTFGSVPLPRPRNANYIERPREWDGA